jgi:hypothetical protein
MSTELACPACRAPLERRQDYCLDCGVRIAPPGRRLHWLWPAAAAALVAAGGAYAAVEVQENGDGRPTIVAIGPLKPVTAPGTGSTGKTTAPKLRRWPARDGFTIVLAAVPTATGSREAESRARQALAAGLPDVGTLESARYASLHPGYTIVFSGVYRSRDEALVALPKAARRFRTAYVQEIAR